VELCEYVWNKYNIPTYVTGGPPDVENGEKFMKLFKGTALNYVGKTTLPQLIGLMATARLTVSVDTGPLHMALAAGSPVLGLFSGKYYKRYAPYPESMDVKLVNLYPDHIDALIKTDDPVLYDPFKTLNDTIYMISAAKAIDQLKKLLQDRSK
jgi:ADP-heptose:LPS heptosyltransferase